MSERLSVGSRAVRGVAWLGSGQLIRQLTAFATNIALARLLFPDDFGLFGMTVAAAEIAQILTDFGLGSALVQRRATSSETLTTCFWLNLAVGIAVGGALCIAGPLLASFFRRAEIALLVLPLGLNMVLAAAMVVPQALLTQQMRFREMTLAQTVGTLIGSAATVGIALAGGGVWALALQPLIGNAVSGAALFAQSRWLPKGRPRARALHGIMSFSSQMLGTSLLATIGRNLHAGILGRQLGSTSLGLYNLASGVTGTILFQISSVIVRVLFPTLANLKDNPERLSRAWMKACSAIAVFGFPAMAGMMAVAPDLMPVVFGKQWIPAVDVLRILSVLMAVQCVLTTSGTVLMALGRADLLLRIGLFSTPALAAGLWIGSQNGVTGAATGYAIASLSTYFVTTWFACRETGVHISRLVAEVIPWALASIGMAMAVAGLAAFLGDMNAPMRLALCVALGGAVYPALLYTFGRRRSLALIGEVVGQLRGRRG